MKESYVILILLVILNNTIAQTWTTYNIPNSIDGRSFNAIAIDAKNTKWIATNEGVVKFDSIEIERYTISQGLANDEVTSVAIDAHGNKWFGTRGGGISKFDGTNWTTYTTSDGLASNYITSIAIDAQDNKWFGTNGGGVSKFNGTSWMTFTKSDGLEDNIVYCIYIDSNDDKWFGTGKYVSKFNNTNWKTYSVSDVRSITQDTQKNMWFGTNAGKVKKWDISKPNDPWSTYDLSTENPYSDNTISAILSDISGNIWFGTKKGIIKFNGTDWITYDTSNASLTDNKVYSICADSHGNLWFGTLQGISKFDGSTWKTFVAGQNYFQNICIDKQNVLWVTTLDIFKFDGTNWTAIPKLGYLYAIDSLNIKWFGTREGISQFNDTSWTTYKTPYEVNDIAVDRHNKKWFAIGGGQVGGPMMSYDGKNWNNVLNQTTFSIAIGSDENIWVQTRWSGIVNLKDGKSYGHLQTNDHICADNDGSIWFGSKHGVLIDNSFVWTNYDELNSKVRSFLGTDAQGNKWFSTNNFGVLKFDGTNWTTYDTSNGLGSNSVTCMVIDQQGNKWFGTTYGLSKFDGKPSLIATPDKFDLIANRDTTIVLTIASDVIWNLSCDQNWINFNKTSGSNNAKVTLTISANTYSNSRTARVNLSPTGIPAPDVSSQVVTITQAGIPTNNSEISNASIDFYPNPVLDFLIIKFPKQFFQANITICQLNGKIIYFSKIENDLIKINMSQFSSGLYTIKIVTSKNVFTKKIIKL